MTISQCENDNQLCDTVQNNKIGTKYIFHFENNIRKIPHNYKLTFSTGFIIFAPGHKVKYYLCTTK